MSESRMNFQEFVDKVKEAIRDALPESFRDAQVSVEPFRKLNTSYLGLQVKKEGQTVVPISGNTRRPGSRLPMC